MHPDIGAALTNGEIVTGFGGTKDSNGDDFAIPHDKSVAAQGLAAIKTDNKDQGTGGGNIILTNANAPRDEHNNKTQKMLIIVPVKTLQKTVLHKQCTLKTIKRILKAHPQMLLEDILNIHLVVTLLWKDMALDLKQLEDLKEHCCIT